MKVYFLLLIVAFVALVYAEESTSTTKIVPTADIPSPPPGVVCPMSVCPSASLLAKREDIVCPSHCQNNCRIIDDVCCPGIKKAVCNSASSDSSNSTATPTTPPTPTSVASSSITSTSSPTATPASDASSFAAVLSTCILAVLLTVGVHQL